MLCACVVVCSINLFSSHSIWWSHTHCIKLVFESTTINNSFSFHIVHGRPHIAHTAHSGTQICTHTHACTVDCTFTHHHNTPHHTAAHNYTEWNLLIIWIEMCMDPIKRSRLRCIHQNVPVWKRINVIMACIHSPFKWFSYSITEIPPFICIEFARFEW